MDEDANVGRVVGKPDAGITHVVLEGVEYLVAEGVVTGKA